MCRISKELVVGHFSGCLGGLGEDPLEEGMAAHFSILTWRIHRWRSLAGHSPWGHGESDTTEVT